MSELQFHLHCWHFFPCNSQPNPTLTEGDGNAATGLARNGPSLFLTRHFVASQRQEAKPASHAAARGQRGGRPQGHHSSPPVSEPEPTTWARKCLLKSHSVMSALASEISPSTVFLREAMGSTCNGSSDWNVARGVRCFRSCCDSQPQLGD